MNRLQAKVAIVTGGGTGIGEAICKKFASEGAKVIVCGFTDDPVEDVVNEIREKGGTAKAFQGDISKSEEAKACIKAAVNKWGKVDILINNAGVFPAVEELQEYPDEAFENMLKNNIRSTYMMTKYALPELQKTKGCIVSAGSEAGMIGIAKNAPYGGTKAFNHAFMKGVAVEQAQYGVRANCVGPGPIDTAWTHKETSGMDKEMEETMVNATAMGRRGSTEEVANVYLFLASDEASYVTGTIYMVDGGITTVKGPVGKKADEAMKKMPEDELFLPHKREGKAEKR